MLLVISIIAAVVITALFSVAVLFWNSETVYSSILPVYLVMIAPVLLIFEKIISEHESLDQKSRPHLPRGLIFISFPLIAAIMAVLRSDLFSFAGESGMLVCTSYLATTILAAHITALVYSLYLLENMYRYALLYQRRIGWVSFIGFLVLVCHQLFFSTRWLLYGWVPVTWLQFAAYLYIPVMLAVPWSFVRYRAGSEKIKVTRDAVYSSFSLLIVGALFTAVGMTLSVLRSFRIALSPLDFKVLGMSVLFAGTILAGSARMRRRVAKLVNRRIYSNRYDYRFQFFSLHRLLGRVEGYVETIEDVLEHLRLSLNADHAYLFIANEHNGNFELVPPKERELPDSVVIKNSSPLVATLQRKGDYFGLLKISAADAMQVDTDMGENFAKLRITDVAPVLHSDSLLAVLALRSEKSAGFDTEDTALIEAYASVIADFLFKHRILRERLEQKQFESFSHMASFIVHDVKNQVATLKLLLRNAEQNIANPKFQESLLVSLQSCTVNLSNLVAKLSMPPRRDRLKLIRAEIAPTLERLIEETGLITLPHILFEKEIKAGIVAGFDENALYYTVKNLVVNALESMEGKEGKLKIRLTSLSDALTWLTERFSGSETFFSSFSAAITIEDTGCGMSEDFLRNRLFRPFSTTKDKGIGIGLYQCKALIEEMGGKVLCDSKVNQGALFCILLS